MAKTNPAAIKGSIKTVPKGKRNGDLIVRGGKRYRVVSYRHPSTGTLVRYLQAVTKCGSPAKKASCKTRVTKRRNPYAAAPQPCYLPADQSKWRPGYRHKSQGRTCVVQRTCAPPLTGKKKGQTFSWDGRRWQVATRKTRAGGYRRFAKEL